MSNGLYRKQIVLEKPDSGLDIFLKEVSKYFSPEYQAMQREQGRADAMLELEQRKQAEAEEIQDENIKINQSREKREKQLFNRQLKEEGEQNFLDDFGLIYNEENRGTKQGIDNARAWVASSPKLSANMYNVIETKLKQDEDMLSKKNQDTDNLGSLLSSMNPDFQYDSSDSMRQLVRNSGDFMLQNSISQKYLGAMSPEMQVMYKQDMSGLSELVKQAFLNPDVSAQNEFIKSVIAPAYTSMVENYGAQGQDISSPSIEGLLSRAGVPIDSDDDINLAKELGGMDKPAGIGDDDDKQPDQDREYSKIFDMLAPFGGGSTLAEVVPGIVNPFMSAITGAPEEAVGFQRTIGGTRIDSPRGQAKVLKRSLDRAINLSKGVPKTVMAGSQPQNKKESKLAEQIEMIREAVGNAYNPATKKIEDPEIRKIFNKLAGKNKDEYYSLLDSIFSAKDDFSLDRLIRTERRPGKKKMRNPFLPTEG
tara:strand:+ start:446 stop:1882 length:1437 start_codon:yes stop_codon:yes gene_type:complete